VARGKKNKEKKERKRNLFCFITAAARAIGEGGPKGRSSIPNP
jgi:hypothetical protein